MIGEGEGKGKTVEKGRKVWSGILIKNREAKGWGAGELEGTKRGERSNEEKRKMEKRVKVKGEEERNWQCRE